MPLADEIMFFFPAADVFLHAFPCDIFLASFLLSYRHLFFPWRQLFSYYSLTSHRLLMPFRSRSLSSKESILLFFDIETFPPLSLFFHPPWSREFSSRFFIPPPHRGPSDPFLPNPLFDTSALFSPLFPSFRVSSFLFFWLAFRGMAPPNHP